MYSIEKRTQSPRKIMC